MTDTLSPALANSTEALVHRILRAACDRGTRIATAESCTGGLFASLLTDVTGCAHAFDRGFVVYTNEAKQEMLGVPGEMLEKEGAVSAPVARAMAVGGLAHSRADLCLAITGFAGEGGPDDEPGLVHFALARRGESVVESVERFGDVGRGAVRLACLDVGLQMLRTSIMR